MSSLGLHKLASVSLNSHRDIGSKVKEQNLYGGALILGRFGVHDQGVLSHHCLKSGGQVAACKVGGFSAFWTFLYRNLGPWRTDQFFPLLNGDSPLFHWFNVDALFADFSILVT